jgi:hypothetical protein
LDEIHDFLKTIVDALHKRPVLTVQTLAAIQRIRAQHYNQPQNCPGWSAIGLPTGAQFKVSKMARLGV